MWEVEFTDEFEEWWESLAEEEQEDVRASVRLLIKHGPALPFPHSSKVTQSRHGHMRELRTQHAGRPYRTLYAFAFLAGRRFSFSAGTKRATTAGTKRTYPSRRVVRRIHRAVTKGRSDPMRHRNFSELQAKMPPDALARSNAKYEKMSRELPLDELREAQRLTQEQLAATLNVKQSAGRWGTNWTRRPVCASSPAVVWSPSTRSHGRRAEA